MKKMIENSKKVLSVIALSGFLMGLAQQAEAKGPISNKDNVSQSIKGASYDYTKVSSLDDVKQSLKTNIANNIENNAPFTSPAVFMDYDNVGMSKLTAKTVTNDNHYLVVVEQVKNQDNTLTQNVYVNNALIDTTSIDKFDQGAISATDISVAKHLDLKQVSTLPLSVTAYNLNYSQIPHSKAQLGVLKTYGEQTQLKLFSNDPNKGVILVLNKGETNVSEILTIKGEKTNLDPSKINQTGIAEMANNGQISPAQIDVNKQVQNNKQQKEQSSLIIYN